jgi:hypothetical protein
LALPLAPDMYAPSIPGAYPHHACDSGRPLARRFPGPYWGALGPGIPQRGDADSMHAHRGVGPAGAYEVNSRAYHDGGYGGMLRGSFRGGHSEHVNSDMYRDGMSAATHRHSHREHAGSVGAGALGEAAGSFQAANSSVHRDFADSGIRRGYEGLAPRIGGDPRRQDYRAAYGSVPGHSGAPSTRYAGDRESRYDRGGGRDVANPSGMFHAASEAEYVRHGGDGGLNPSYRDRDREINGGRRDYGATYEPRDRGPSYGAPAKQNSVSAHAGMLGFHETAHSSGSYCAHPGNRVADERADSARHEQGNAGYHAPYTRESGYKPSHNSHGDGVHGRALPHINFDDTRGAYFGENSDSDARLHARTETRDRDAAYMTSRVGKPHEDSWDQSRHGSGSAHDHYEQKGARADHYASGSGQFGNLPRQHGTPQQGSTPYSASVGNTAAYSAASMPYSDRSGPDAYSQGAVGHAGRGTAQHPYGHGVYGSSSGHPYSDHGRHQQAPGWGQETDYASVKRQRY